MEKNITVTVILGAVLVVLAIPTFIWSSQQIGWFSPLEIVPSVVEPEKPIPTVIVPEIAPDEEPPIEQMPELKTEMLPVAKIFGPASAKRGSMVSFTSEFSHDPDGGEIVESKWIFDDEREFTGEVIEFRVLVTQKHTIMLIVTDDEGQIGFDRFIIDIIP